MRIAPFIFWNGDPETRPDVSQIALMGASDSELPKSLVPPVTPSKIVCVGRNYADTRQSSAMTYLESHCYS